MKVKLWGGRECWFFKWFGKRVYERAAADAVTKIWVS